MATLWSKNINASVVTSREILEPLIRIEIVHTETMVHKIIDTLA